MLCLATFGENTRSPLLQMEGIFSRVVRINDFPDTLPSGALCFKAYVSGISAGVNYESWLLFLLPMRVS